MFSLGVIAVGRFIRVSGQSPKQNGVVVGETIAEQTTVALENLAETGAGLPGVVRRGVFLNDMSGFEEMNRVYLSTLPAPLPARTTVGVQLRGFKVEIDCDAVLPEAV